MLSPTCLKDYFQNYATSELQIVGPFYDAQEVLKEPVIYVDAGVQFRKGVIGFSVGDGDSSTTALDEKLDMKKNFSDLAYVLQHVPSHFLNIQLLGFLGHRQDHELMNLAEVHEFLEGSAQTVQIHFDKKIQAFSKGIWDLVITGSFSVFSFEETSLQLSGDCDYQIRPGQTFSARSSQGLSNIGLGPIKLVCDKPVFLFHNTNE